LPCVARGVVRGVHDATRRILPHLAKVYSPEGVEGVFCELRIRDPAWTGTPADAGASAAPWQAYLSTLRVGVVDRDASRCIAGKEQEIS
jgi:hypothetical protein